ncbi:hypothetical protein [Thermococcus sp.]
MDLGTVFNVLNWLLIFGICYWSLRTALSLLTYIKPGWYVLLFLSVLIPFVSIKLGFVLGFFATFSYLLLKRVGIGLAFSTSVLAFVLFFVGAVSITIILGIAGTALGVPGYQMHGTLRELVERFYG